MCISNDAQCNFPFPVFHLLQLVILMIQKFLQNYKNDLSACIGIWFITGQNEVGASFWRQDDLSNLLTARSFAVETWHIIWFLKSSVVIINDDELLSILYAWRVTLIFPFFMLTYLVRSKKIKIKTKWNSFFIIH